MHCQLDEISAQDLFSEEWHDHDRGGQLPCTSARTLSAYLLSESAETASVSAVSLVGIPDAIVAVAGPRCGDGKHLRVSYNLNRGEFSRLPEKEKRAFVDRLLELMAPEEPSWRVFAVLGIPKPSNS